jgi:hypothetical protein
LPIAYSTYYEHKVRQADPGRLPPRLRRRRLKRVSFSGNIPRKYREPPALFSKEFFQPVEDNISRMIQTIAA